jgi:hypothetical protein
MGWMGHVAHVGEIRKVLKRKDHFGDLHAHMEE